MNKYTIIYESYTKIASRHNAWVTDKVTVLANSITEALRNSELATEYSGLRVIAVFANSFHDNLT